MRKLLSKLCLAAMALGATLAVTSTALAEEPAGGGDKGGTTLFSTTTAGATFGCAIGAGLVLMGGGAAVGRIGSSAVESMARQPEAAGSINGAMILTAAMVEGATLFGVVVCLLGVLKS